MKVGVSLEKPHKFAGSQIRLLILMYFAYAVTMLMKHSIIVVSPTLITDPLIAMSKTEFGDILASGSFGGILGKILFGLAADRFGGKISFFVSLLILAIGIMTFGFNVNFFAFMIIYFSLALAKAGGWPSLAKMIGRSYHSSQHGRAWGYIATASRFGTIVATLGLGFLLNYLPWQHILYLAASLGVIMCVIWHFGAREQIVEFKKEESLPDEQSQEQVAQEHIDHPLYNTTLRFALFDFMTSARVLLIFFAMMGLTIMTDFLHFVPIFIKETLSLSDANANMTASAFPIGAVVAVLAGGYVFDTLSKRTTTKVIGVFLALAVLCILGIYQLTSFSFSQSTNIVIVYICLFGFGVSVAPAYYLPMSLFSIKYGGHTLEY
jgi:MFS transporter, OPA family, sugar phosphate sensor protein UhpC